MKGIRGAADMLRTMPRGGEPWYRLTVWRRPFYGLPEQVVEAFECQHPTIFALMVGRMVAERKGLERGLYCFQAEVHNRY